jgi:ABC-type amino acid transport substrate-binding protein
MTKKCTIFSGGEAVSAQCVAEYKPFIDDSLVISADKGYKLAQAVGVKSDIIMGDFDSAEKPVLTVGMEGTYAPYTYHDENGTLTGFEVDIVFSNL